MFRLKVFKTRQFLWCWRKKSRWKTNYPSFIWQRLHAGPQHNARFFLVACIFRVTSVTFQQLGSPSCFHRAALQKLPYFSQIWFPGFSICSVFANIELLNQIKCPHSHFLWFCVRDQIKLDVFHVMNSVRNIYFVICNDSNLKEWNGNGWGGNLSTPNAASCFLDRCLFWVVWFCTDVHIHKVEK